MKKLSETHKKRSLLASEPELATIEGLLNRNMQAIKFSVSRERDRLLAKQKYKRSEQVRSLMDNKKMSSITKIERKDTDHSSRMLDPSLPKQRPVPDFRDLNLETVINPHPQKHHEVTLQECFD
jgi:C4-type Zn-finger protein